jgi:hypothetical protein
MGNATEPYKPLVDWLTYRSYEHNRLRSAHIPYYKWRRIYEDAVIFEEIFDNYLKLTKHGV